MRERIDVIWPKIDAQFTAQPIAVTAVQFLPQFNHLAHSGYGGTAFKWPKRHTHDHDYTSRLLFNVFNFFLLFVFDETKTCIVYTPINFFLIEPAASQSANDTHTQCEICETEKQKKNALSDVSYMPLRSTAGCQKVEPSTFEAIEQESKFKTNDKKKKCFLFFIFFFLEFVVQCVNGVPQQLYVRPYGAVPTAPLTVFSISIIFSLNVMSALALTVSFFDAFLDHRPNKMCFLSFESHRIQMHFSIVLLRECKMVFFCFFVVFIFAAEICMRFNNWWCHWWIRLHILCKVR